MSGEYDPTDPPTFNAAEDDAPMIIPETIGDDADEYDPSPFTSDATALAPPTQSETTSRSGSTVPASIPLKAGFIIEESDDEDATKGVTGVVVDEAQDDGSKTEEQQIQLGSAPVSGSTSAVLSAQETNGVNGSAAFVPAPASTSLPSDVSSLVPPSNGEHLPLQSSTMDDAARSSTTKAQFNVRRLAHDKVGHLEDRISDEPRADPEAFESLIAHYQEKNQLDNMRKTYDRFLAIFPTSASIWLAYLNFEQEHDEAARIDVLLERALREVLNIDLWLFYLNVLRRRNPLINDTTGKSRQIISQAFEFVLDKVGIDPDAGRLWREYIEFLKSGPGTVSAASTHWQDQQKVDLLRKAYQKAVTIPHDELVKLWKEYDSFELGFNRATGRKFLNERSPHYMTAKAANMQLEDKLRGLDRSSLPRLPPLPGFAGDVEFGTQLAKWRGWVAWEKADELVLKQDELELYRKRIDYAYTQATMALRFFPEIWFDAACWCFEQGTDQWKRQGERYLDNGIIANPESPLLALRKADLIESGFKGSSDVDDIAIQNGNKLDVVFEKVHHALYAQKKKYVQREEKALAGVEEYFATLPPEETAVVPIPDDEEGDDDEDMAAAKPKSRAEQKEEQTKAIKLVTTGLQDNIKKTISYVWVAKMRAFRRVQGQGKPKEAKKGFRGVFAEARPRGSLTSDVYVASALMEYFGYADVTATKIFERGLKLFPTDEFFILEYIKHLVAKNDITNAKAVFETSMTKIERLEDITIDQRRVKSRPLLTYMYQFESDYGDLGAIHRLAARMAELYPDEPEVARFTQRFELPNLDASRTILALSPTQMQPKMAIIEPTLASVQAASGFPAGLVSPLPGQMLLGPHGPYIASPKRPLDDADDDSPAAKYLRGESPLKGAAGRRIATASGAATVAAGNIALRNVSQTQSLPNAILQLLAVLPSADSYKATRFVPEKMVELMKHVDLTRARRIN